MAAKIEEVKSPLLAYTLLFCVFWLVTAWLDNFCLSFVIAVALGFTLDLLAKYVTNERYLGLFSAVVGEEVRVEERRQQEEQADFYDRPLPPEPEEPEYEEGEDEEQQVRLLSENETKKDLKDPQNLEHPKDLEDLKELEDLKAPSEERLEEEEHVFQQQQQPVYESGYDGDVDDRQQNQQEQVSDEVAAPEAVAESHEPDADEALQAREAAVSDHQEATPPDVTQPKEQSVLLASESGYEADVEERIAAKEETGAKDEDEEEGESSDHQYEADGNLLRETLDHLKKEEAKAAENSSTSTSSSSSSSSSSSEAEVEQEKVSLVLEMAEADAELPPGLVERDDEVKEAKSEEKGSAEVDSDLQAHQSVQDPHSLGSLSSEHREEIEVEKEDFDPLHRVVDPVTTDEQATAASPGEDLVLLDLDEPQAQPSPSGGDPNVLEASADLADPASKEEPKEQDQKEPSSPDDFEKAVKSDEEQLGQSIKAVDIAQIPVENLIDMKELQTNLAGSDSSKDTSLESHENPLGTDQRHEGEVGEKEPVTSVQSDSMIDPGASVATEEGKKASQIEDDDSQQKEESLAYDLLIDSSNTPASFLSPSGGHISVGDNQHKGQLGHDELLMDSSTLAQSAEQGKPSMGEENMLVEGSDSVPSAGPPPAIGVDPSGIGQAIHDEVVIGSDTVVTAPAVSADDVVSEPKPQPSGTTGTDNDDPFSFVSADDPKKSTNTQVIAGEDEIELPKVSVDDDEEDSLEEEVYVLPPKLQDEGDPWASQGAAKATGGSEGDNLLVSASLEVESLAPSDNVSQRAIFGDDDDPDEHDFDGLEEKLLDEDLSPGAAKEQLEHIHHFDPADPSVIEAAETVQKYTRGYLARKRMKEGKDV